MKSAPPTNDETQRLQALYSYDILDTEAEKVFDDLTELASEICETPIALISLVDPDRQWFKSKIGVDVSETHRDIAFCAHAIHEREVFEVPNALEDERFCDNPLVTEDPNIRFYAGAQLVTPSGHAIGTLCTISDKPKKLNDHQRKALQILSRQVIAQMELRQSLKEAKDASDFKTEFLSNISHEVRTPLNAITGFSQAIIEQSSKTPLPADIHDYVQEIDFSAGRLLHIVNSVLDLSKIEAGKMEVIPTWFQAAKFLQHINGMMQIKAKEKDVSLNFDIAEDLPELLFLDEGKVGQILINIINNAVKFTEAGKHIFVSAHVNSHSLNFVIEDQGIGISKENQLNLFNKYEQVGNKRNSEGTGLGLCITKSLVELMEGDIALTSQLGKGTKLTVSLPLSDIEVPKDLNFDSNIRCDIAGLKVLIVEDNAINRKVATIVFKSLNQDFSFAHDGESAVTLCQENEYDVIFMDIHLPGIDGIEASNQIRALGITTPIVALTADVFQIQQQENNHFAFDGYLSKPIEKKRIVEYFTDNTLPLSTSSKTI
ncbi:MAG: ATP-binding protein [Thalassotalea sp.]|nr:ATP-binding protein [Thalassotalea sp.]